MTAAIVLCGGRSSRMGRSKADLPFAGGTMLSRVVQTLGEVVEVVAVVASPDQVLPALPAGTRVARDAAEGLGPLSGFTAGLESLPDSARVVFLTSCDVPFLKPEFARFVLDRLAHHDIAMPRIDGIAQPLAAAYRVEGLLPRAGKLLLSGRRGIVDLLADADVVWISAEDLKRADSDLDSLRNVNTPVEYEAALRSLASTDTL